MSAITEALLDALQERETDIGATINWAGDDFPCAGGVDFARQILTAGGFKTTTNVVIVVRVGAFPAGQGVPQPKQNLVYTSAPGAAARPLYIDSTTPAMGVFLVLNCIDRSQGS